MHGPKRSVHREGNISQSGLGVMLLDARVLYKACRSTNLRTWPVLILLPPSSDSSSWFVAMHAVILLSASFMLSCSRSIAATAKTYSTRIIEHLSGCSHIMPAGGDATKLGWCGVQNPIGSFLKAATDHPETHNYHSAAAVRPESFCLNNCLMNRIVRHEGAGGRGMLDLGKLRCASVKLPFALLAPSVHIWAALSLRGLELPSATFPLHHHSTHVN